MNGFVVNSIEEAIDAVGRIPTISRRLCRDTFEQKYTAERMARDYVRVYQRLIEQNDFSRHALVGETG